MRYVARPGGIEKLIHRIPFIGLLQTRVGINIALRTIIHNRMVVQRRPGWKRREQLHSDVRKMLRETIGDRRLAGAIETRDVDEAGRADIPVKIKPGGCRIARCRNRSASRIQMPEYIFHYDGVRCESIAREGISVALRAESDLNRRVSKTIGIGACQFLRGIRIIGRGNVMYVLCRAKIPVRVAGVVAFDYIDYMVRIDPGHEAALIQNGPSERRYCRRRDAPRKSRSLLVYEDIVIPNRSYGRKGYRHIVLIEIEIARIDGKAKIIVVLGISNDRIVEKYANQHLRIRRRIIGNAHLKRGGIVLHQTHCAHGAERYNRLMERYKAIALHDLHPCFEREQRL